MDLQGTILRVDGTNCIIHSNGKTYRAYMKKRILGSNPEEIKPIAVGDEVIFEYRNDEDILLKEVLPRKSWLMRQAVGKPGKRQVVVANVEQMLVIGSISSPAFSNGIIDRFLTAAAKGKLLPIIAINKFDLKDQEANWPEIEKKIKTYTSLNYKVVCSSIHDLNSLQSLKNLLVGHSTVIVGHSGVGKSSLLSKIDPNIQLKVGEINPKSQKGRHTTTSVMIFPLQDGGFVVDTPGIREFTLWKMETWELSQYFPEMASELLTCKYKKCTHTHEPYCAVKIALEEERIADFRYQSYCRILDSILHPNLEAEEDN